MFHTLRRRIIYKGRSWFSEQRLALRTREEVEKAMKGLLANEDVAPLPAAEVKLIKKYAQDVFGSDAYFPWLHFYSIYRGRFLEGWIPTNFFQNVAIKHVNGTHYMLDEARTLQRRLLDTPSLPDIAHFVSGEWRTISGEILAPSELKQTLFREDDEICIKTEASSRGKGVSFETRETFERARVESLGNLVVQRPIRQGEFFEAIFPKAVNTLRVLTGKTPGVRPRLLGSYLKVGLGQTRAVVDDSLAVPLLDASGLLGDFASDENWKRFTEHPDTGFRFAGVRVPDFDKALAHCLDLHDRLPQIGLIGWDVVIDRAGDVQVMEFNTGHPGIKFIEMSAGPCLQMFRMEQYASPAPAASTV